MATRGRKPKPTEAKRLAGNPGHRPLNDGEPSPTAASRRLPHGLSRGAKKLWREIAGELIDLGVLKVTDVPALILMAEQYSVARGAARAIAEEGLTTTDEHGCVRKHPLLQVLRDSSSAYRMYATEFGLTPSSRSRLSVAPQEEQLSLAELLFSGVSDQDVTVADE